MLTAESITDVIIDSLRSECLRDGDHGVVRYCDIALGTIRQSPRVKRISTAEAREICAQEWNHRRSRLTADTVTDAQIVALRESLPSGHYAHQWTIDALWPSSSHPHRQRNARQQCAEILNERRSA